MNYTQILTFALGSMGAAAMAQTTLVSQQAAPVNYHLIDLGPVGMPPGAANFIPNNGVVAGAVETGGAVHAVAWFGGHLIDIGANKLGGPNSQAFGVNDRGQVVGEAQTSDPNGEDFCGFNQMGLLPSGNACRAFLWQNGLVAELKNTLGGANSVANQINNRGDVVGFAETNQQREAGCGVGRFAPVIWRNGIMQTLPTYAGDPDATAFAINDQGQTVGASGSCAPFNPNSQLNLLEAHAVLWDATGVHLIPGFGGDGGFGGNHACGINNLGQVVGHSDLPGDAAFYGFLWSKETGTLMLKPYGEDFASVANSINDRGQAVGGSFDANFAFRAMLWQDRIGIDLNSVVPGNTAMHLDIAFGINASGEIVGFGDIDGELHGFLATPNSSGEEERLLPGEARVPRTPLSVNARRLLFQRLGIRRP